MPVLVSSPDFCSAPSSLVVVVVVVEIFICPRPIRGYKNHDGI